jgi:hypothetical protein
MGRRVMHISWKARRKETLRKPICRSEDNIKMNIRETSWAHMDRIRLAQDRDQSVALVNMVMSLRIS